MSDRRAGKLASAQSIIMDAFRSAFRTLFPRLKQYRARQRVKRYYNDMTSDIEDDFLPFMNWGYAPLDGQEDDLKLELEDEPWRFSIQLYNHVAGQVDLRGMNILEVGCGRGGGCFFMMRYLMPRQVVGLDLSESNIALCRRKYHLKGMSFHQGNAEALPFDDSSFDAVINIESSHCYPEPEKFYQEVIRVLKKEGYFLYADFRMPREMTKLRQTLGKFPALALIKEHDITSNIVKALKDYSPQKQKMILSSFGEAEQIQDYSDWACLEGTSGYNRLLNREDVYSSFLLQKRY